MISTVVKERPAEVVYFIRSRTTGLIKIGITRNLKKRTSEIRHACGSEVEVLAAVPGRYCDETAIHRKFRNLRVIGEWFSPDQTLLDAMNKLIESRRFDHFRINRGIIKTNGINAELISIVAACNRLKVSRPEFWRAINCFRLSVEPHPFNPRSHVITPEVFAVLERILKPANKIVRMTPEAALAG